MKIKKDITFIYMDNAEKAMYLPIAEEAQKRGYSVRFTTDKFAKCEIGFYCQHINFPENSKFSIIMLHDIIQQYANWPDIWYREPWNIYDIGILPSNQWVKNWSDSSCFFYSRPRYGVYKIGWPKADVISKIKENTYRDLFFSKYGLDINKKTILYAPAWENDNKEDDFVKAMQQLNVNMLIKQAPWIKEDYPEIYENCEKMAKLHKNLENVCILPRETNIFEAIAVSDILVSEESSTMCEAAMIGIPAISVSDWLIPDVKPSRLPRCDYNFVQMCLKNELSITTKKMLDNYAYYKRNVEKFRDDNFSNIGCSSIKIMDLIDNVIYGIGQCQTQLVAKPLVRLGFKNNKKRIIYQLKVKAAEKAKYKKIYSLFRKIYKFFHR